MTVSIGFTGTQHSLTEAQDAALYARLKAYRTRARWMNNGDCIGADEAAAGMWRSLGGLIRLHPPRISTKRANLAWDERREPLPYLDRNKAIVDTSAALIAAPCDAAETLRSGTWSTVRYARKLSRPIEIVLPDGTVRRENWSAQTRIVA